MAGTTELCTKTPLFRSPGHSGEFNIYPVLKHALFLSRSAQWVTKISVWRGQQNSAQKFRSSAPQDRAENLTFTQIWNTPYFSTPALNKSLKLPYGGDNRTLHWNSASRSLRHSGNLTFTRCLNKPHLSAPEANKSLKLPYCGDNRTQHQSNNANIWNF